MVVDPSKANYCRRIDGNFYSNSKTLMPSQKYLKKCLAFSLLFGCNAAWTGFLTKYSEFDLVLGYLGSLVHWYFGTWRTFFLYWEKIGSYCRHWICTIIHTHKTFNFSYISRDPIWYSWDLAKIIRAPVFFIIFYFNVWVY